MRTKKRNKALSLITAVILSATIFAVPASAVSVGETVELHAGTYLWSGSSVDDPEIAKLMEPLSVEITGEKTGSRYPVKAGIIDGYVDAAILDGSSFDSSAYSAEEIQNLRYDIVNYAMQFIGNPYVWGGTSLTNGADCSGFVQSVFADYGITVPRTSQEQGNFGTQKSLSDANIGDLILYSNGYDAYHVAIYAGDGMTVQAANSAEGIVMKAVNGNAAWAVDVIE